MLYYDTYQRYLYVNLISMNTKNVVLGGVVGTIFIFLFDWVVHGMLLMGMYEATSDIWRPMSEMESMFIFMIFTQALLAFAIAYFVGKKHIHGAKGGAHFGMMIGVFLGIMALTQYNYLPLDLTLPIVWAVAIFASATCVGAIAGHFNK